MVVGVSGYYGFQNAGDEAILEAIVHQLKERQHTPLVFSANPAATAQHYKVQAVKRMHLPSLWQAMGQIDLLLLGGGGLLQDKTSSLSLAYYLGMARLARLRGKPVWVFNQSLGPLSRRGEGWVRQQLRGVRSIFREQSSLDYALSLGLNAQLGADPALLLPVPPVHREKNLVVLVLRAGLTDANETLKKAGERLVAEGYEVLALGMQPGHDESALENLPQFTKELAWDPKRVMYLLSQASYVLSIRLHGLILAAAAGTPFAGLSYDPKVAGFCRDAGALFQELPGQPQGLVEAVLTQQQPDWVKIQAMKMRASQSFDEVFKPRSNLYTPSS